MDRYDHWHESKFIDAQAEIADLKEQLRLSGLRGDSLDRVVEEGVQKEMELGRQIATLKAEKDRLRFRLRLAFGDIATLLSHDVTRDDITQAFLIAQDAIKQEEEK